MRFPNSIFITLSFLTMTTCSYAQSGTELPFETHAGFFSAETSLAVAIDPQVFVIDHDAQAEVGAQGIAHVAGIRNARTSDSPSLPVYSASGKSLNMTSGQWLGASGNVALMPVSGGHEKVIVRLAGLKPGAVYSLFENHFDRRPTGFTPLDGAGLKNTFKADSKGAATMTITTPEVLTHANAVLVVYHSDGRSHGTSRGDIGVDAHHQLIVRVQ